MIRKSSPSGFDPMGGSRFSEKIMLHSNTSAGAPKQRRFPGGKRNAEQRAKAALAVGGNLQRARIADARDPAEFEAAAGERRTERAGQMQPALAPVDTWPAERAAAALDVLKMDAEVSEEFLAGVRDHAAVFAKDDVFVPGERVGQSDAEPSGNMVVAGARGA